MSSHFPKTKLAFKLTEVIQGLEEEKVALKSFMHELSVLQTDDDELKSMVDTIRTKLGSATRDNRVAKWRDIMSLLLGDFQSDACLSFVKQVSDLLE